MDTAREREREGGREGLSIKHVSLRTAASAVQRELSKYETTVFLLTLTFCSCHAIEFSRDVFCPHDLLDEFKVHGRAK